jgi:hypothetical protein
MIDTSGAEPPRGIQMAAVMGGGVYPQLTGGVNEDNVLTGRISLGILGIFVLGAVAFYIWTHSIQGGG